jgi:peptide chain release factor 1
MDLREQLAKFAARHAAIQQELMSPEIGNNPTKLVALNRESAELQPLVDAYNEYDKLLRQRDDAQAMLSDPDMKAMAQEEYDDALARIPQMEADLKVLLLPKDKDDSRNIILEVRAGTGGEEAALFAAEIMKMYLLYAVTQGWKTEMQESAHAEKGGLREGIARIAGNNVYGKLKFESGVHRVQRVPLTETQGRVHTSAVTVAVLPEAEDIDIKIEEKDLRIDVFRSSGPGGQSVNTTDSAVRVTHIPTGVVVSCQDEKSQIKNKAKALKQLATRLYAAQKEKQDMERAANRKSMVGSGDRSEKIRTYNFPQNRVTDHRIEFTVHNLPDVMAGGKNLNELILNLQRADEADRLASLAEETA